MRDGLGTFRVALLAVACCAGLPLLLAGLTVAGLAWIGGFAVGLAALAVAVALLVERARKLALSRPTSRRRTEAGR